MNLTSIKCRLPSIKIDPIIEKWIFYLSKNKVRPMPKKNTFNSYPPITSLDPVSALDENWLQMQGLSLADLPFITIIIPTFNCSQSLSLTLESVLDQEYENYEVLAIDAGSSDRTLEVLFSYDNPKLRIGSVDRYNVYEMINKGIELAQGEYINVLFPGDFYIHHHTLLDISRVALQYHRPQLVYCGTLLRDGRAEVKFLFRRLNLDLLRKGQQPTSLQGCWFKKEAFKIIGNFGTEYKLRGGFEILCRFCLSRLSSAALHRALIDYDLRSVTSAMVVRHFSETIRIIYRYFGLVTMLRWVRRQKDSRRFAALWLRRVRFAFLGK